MDRESVNRLRFDRRLEQRPGWVAPADQESNIEALPDVTEKMTQGLDEPEEAEAADSADGIAVTEPISSVEAPNPGGFTPFSGGGSELS